MTSIPYAVSRLLASAIARVRRIYLVRGLAAVGIVWLLGVAAVMAADARFVIFDDRIRWAMTASVLLLVLLTAMLAVVLPLCRRLDFRKMAKALDARHPEMEERFSTLVELAESDVSKAGFSASLFALVCKLAEDDAAKIALKREFPYFGAFRRLGVFFALLLALGVGIGVSPNLVGLLFVRAVAPWVDVGNLFSSDIAVKPGDLVALSGSVIRIEAAPTSHPSPSSPAYTIRLSRRTGSGWTEETTEPMANGVYETTADLNEREWRYRVNAGPAVTRYYYVRVSDLPKYDRFTARVDYPAYTGFAPSVCSNDAVAAIRAIEGSRVTFGLQVSEPGTVADFRIGGAPVFEYTMVSNRTSEWSLDLVNRDGFRSSKGRHPLVSFPDQPPTVVIESPASQLPKLPPHAKIHVELTASDDVSVARPDIRYSVDGAEMAVLRAVDEFASAGGNLWRGKADIDLSMLDLSNARNVRFDILARDTCPAEYGGPHVVTSSVISVTLEVREWGLEVADVREQAKKAETLIDEAKKRMRDAERLARQLHEELKRKGRVSEDAERKNEAAAHEASEAERRLEELRDRLEGDERFAPLAKPLEKTRAETLRPALERIENAQFRDRDERAEEMAKAADELRRAQDQMDELAKRLKDRAEKLDAFEKAKDLAERQDALARSAQALLDERPTDVSKLEAWKRLEEEAMRRTEELARIRPDADIAEARRKMETAARKIEELKRDLAEQARREAEEKKSAEENARREAESAARHAQAMAKAAEEQKRAEAAQEKGDAQTVADAQHKAGEQLEKAHAMPGVKAMQRLARAAQKKADKAAASRPKENPNAAQPLAEAAKKAQREASAARAQEQEIRKAIAEGTKTEKDLDAFDAALRERIRQQAAAQPVDAAEAARRKALDEAAAEQKKAADALHEAADRRADERRLRRSEKPRDAAAMAQKAEAHGHKAAAAQKAAAHGLWRGEATDGVKAMQLLAEKAASDAQRASRSVEKAARAEAVQKAAQEALRDELALRDAMRTGEKTSADLEAFDRGLRQAAKAKEAEMAAADAEAARRERMAEERAMQQAQDLREAAASQGRALQAMQQAAARRDEERRLSAAGNRSAAETRARDAERSEARAAEAQQSAEDRLERAEATSAVKAMQKHASALERLAREAPHTAEKSAAAVAAQKAAAEALAREQAIREAIRKGDKTEADLLAFANELNEGLRKAAAERLAAAKAAAERAIRAAHEAVGTAGPEEIDKLADAALEAKRDEVAAELAARALDGEAAKVAALRDVEDALDAVRAQDNEERAREDRILSMQKTAAESFERGDRHRALQLQKEIARAQSRAAEAAADDEAAARAAANAAQTAAGEVGDRTQYEWNNETRAAAAKAQREAMESERVAQAAARANRAADKLAAAEKAVAVQPSEATQPSRAAPDGTEAYATKRLVSDAANEAAAAMNREVRTQASELGISGAKNASEQDEGAGKREQDGGGGNVNDEVDRLARELRRGDSPDFFKKLFGRLGWFKIRGVSKDGLREQDLSDVPREYRDLVRRYFLKLAEENPPTP